MMKAQVSETFNPTMLILARESRSLSQKELVDRVNTHAKEALLNQSRLSRLEAGVGLMEGKILDSLSTILEYPSQFFYQQARMSSIGTRYFRKAKTMPKQVLRAILATMDIDRIRVESLLRSAELETKEIPHYEVDGVRFKTASSVAKAVREAWRVPRGPVENMTKLMEDAAIVVLPMKAGSRHFSGVHIPTEVGVPIVFVNSEIPWDRVRFTLAHELGHIVMHDVTDDETQSEDQSDEFASEFLLPETEIRSYLYGLTLEMAASLKLRWKVSMASVIHRAVDLKCISPEQSEVLWKKMSRAGYRLSEPHSAQIQAEYPTLLKEVIDLHQSVLGYTHDELKQLLWLDAEASKRFFVQEQPRLRIYRG
jgi:Zn-dependent peptidase ImmA (M78 family)